MSVSLFTGGSLYDVTSCLTAWPQVPSGRCLCPGGLCPGASLSGGLFLARLCPGESLLGGGRGFSVRVKSGRYGPYRNAFLFDTIYSNCANQNHRILRNMESQQQVLSVVQKLTLRARE